MRDLARSLIGSRAFVFLATLVAHAVIVWAGPSVDVDGQLYARLADGILRGDWSGVFDPSRLLWTKSIFIAIVAGAKVVAPAQWPVVVVAVNVICSATTATLVVSLVRRATDSVPAAWAALFFFAGSFEFAFWNRFIWTDPLYLLLATAAFALVARPILTGRRPRSLLPLAATLILASFTRPPGVVLVFLAFVGAVAFWPRPEGRELSAGRRRMLWFAVALTLIAGVAIRTWIVHDPSRWPTDLVRPKIEEFAAREKTGAVVIGHASSYHARPVTFADHLAIEAARFARFFQFLSSEFSPRHNWVNASFFIPLYALGILGVIDGVRTADRKRRHLVMLTLLWIGVFAYCHAITFLESLWRYRTPLLIQMIVLAAYGVEAVHAMITSRCRLDTADAVSEEIDAVGN